ncbi:unnamed protein product [Malus baccata var. baccata]
MNKYEKPKQKSSCARIQFMTRSSQPISANILKFDDDFERSLRRNRRQSEPHPPSSRLEVESEFEEEEEEQVMAADNCTIKELSALGLDNAVPLCIQYPEVAQGKTDEFELKSSLLHHIPKYHELSMEDPNKHLKEFEVVCSSMTPINVDGSILKMKAFPFFLMDKAKNWLYELTPGTVTSWESIKRAFLEKVILLRKRISGIQQSQGESFPAYYERFKGLVASCPQHQMKKELLLQYFYEGLLPIERQMLDASASDALVDKTPVATKILIFMEGCKLQGNTPSVCSVCSMQGHLNDQCPQLIENRGWESANAIGSLNNPNNKEDIDSHLPGSIKGHSYHHKSHRNLPKPIQGQQNQNKTMLNQAKEVDELKKKMGQMAEFMGQFREQGFETAKAITLRSGKELGNYQQPSKQSLNKDEKLLQEEEQEEQATIREDQPLPQPPMASKSSQPIKVSPNSSSTSSIPLNVPFPSRFRQSKKEEYEKDILKTFRKVQVNIPLLEAIKQVPKYAKFLKELCTTRKRISNKEAVNNLIFLADFYVLDMEDSAHSTPLPILLGRPFMKTAHTKIDVFKGTLAMEFDREIIDFNIFEAIKFPKDDHSCFSIDVFDSLAYDYLDSLDRDPLETTIA